MYVFRDFLQSLLTTHPQESVLVWGSRQVGKTTLLLQTAPQSQVYLDDLNQRQIAQNDPALFLDGLPTPCLIDEVQYAPNLFPELKLRIDKHRRERLHKPKIPQRPLYFLTGSNKTMLDLNIKESLAGRCSTYSLHGLSVHELLTFNTELPLHQILTRGGFPEIYTNDSLSVDRYLNDYILSFIEKDIAVSSGIEKLEQFHMTLRLLAARTGQFLNVSEIANAAGVRQNTVQTWIDILRRNLIIELIEPYHSNLSKRIVKMPKLYFYDVGICSRLQGHLNSSLLWNSPQAGSLFETLVFSEIVKTRDNFLRDWQIFTWRTKEKKEIDFILCQGNSILFLEVKMSVYGTSSFEIDTEAQKVFKKPYNKIVVNAGSQPLQLDSETRSIPIAQLGQFLLSFFA